MESLNDTREIKGMAWWIYKKCVADEYQDRTGKCAWGFASVRNKLGYDPVTGKEL